MIPLSLLLLTTSTALPQESVDRVTTEHLFGHEVNMNSSGPTTHGNLDVNVDTLSFAFEPSPSPSVNLKALRLNGSVGVGHALHLTTVDSGPNEILRSRLFDAFGCGGNCLWFDVSSGGSTEQHSTPVQPGEPFVENWQTASSFDSLYLPGASGYLWDLLVQFPSWLGSPGMQAVWYADESVYVLEGLSFAFVDVTFQLTYQLDRISSTPYCSSRANSTGQTADLRGYGWAAADTDWLTVRVDSVPDGAYGALLVGTTSAMDVAATTTLCVGGLVTRAGGVQVAEEGKFDFEVDLTGRMQGESIYLQSYFRDPVAGVSASNATMFTLE